MNNSNYDYLQRIFAEIRNQDKPVQQDVEGMTISAINESLEPMPTKEKPEDPSHDGSTSFRAFTCGD